MVRGRHTILGVLKVAAGARKSRDFGANQTDQQREPELLTYGPYPYFLCEGEME